MPLFKSLRDTDLRMMEKSGRISPSEAKISTLKRDMKDMKRRSLCLGVILIGLTAEVVYFGFHVYFVIGLVFYLLIRDVYFTWVKLAEMETEIKYLEAGLILTRTRKEW